MTIVTCLNATKENRPCPCKFIDRETMGCTKDEITLRRGDDGPYCLDWEFYIP